MERRAQRGFTMVELMITVAIIAVLTAVAYPAYTNHVVRAKRSAATSFMVTVANKEEQAMLNARSYFSIAAGTTAQWSAVNVTVPQEVSDNYTVTVTTSAGPPPGYTITATPIGSQYTKDTKCGTLTYKQDGTKGVTGPSGVSNCWK